MSVAADLQGIVPAQEPLPEGLRFSRTIALVAEGVLVFALLGELAVVIANVLGRTFSRTGFMWTGEVAQLALSTLTFIGGIVAYRRLQHAPVRAMLGLLPERGRRFCLALADVLVLLGSLIAGTGSVALIQSGWQERTPILAFPASSIAIPLAIGMAMLALFAIERLWIEHRADAPAALGGTMLVLGAGFATHDFWQPLLVGDVAIAVVLALFVVTILAGLPVGFALLLCSAGYIWIANAAPLTALPQNMVYGTGNYVLLAVPFFIFAGLIMERGGISSRLVRFVQTLVGHLRGGLLQVMVVSMYLVSGLSGSKAADVAAVGSVMREMLAREGYGAGEGAAVLAASAAMGETVPPSIAMLVLGSITSLSMAALFIGGLIPAAVIGVCLMILIYVRARLANVPRAARPPLGVLLRAAAGAILPLLMPVLLFGGILFGIATPTEVSSFAVIYGVVLAMIVYRELTPGALGRTIVDSASLTGMILFILAAASAFSWVLTVAQLPQRLVGVLHAVNDSVAIFLVGSVILLIVAGSLLEGLPALNVLAPLLIPIAGQIGVSQLHYGMVLIIAMGVGAFMPPAGVGFYVCCAIQRTSVEEAARAMIPYLVVLVVGLLIVTFVPWFTLSLPHAFGFARA